jgi:hypothetical protein
MFPPVDSARRRFLTNAAGAAASGTVLSLATISPTRAAAAPDPIHAAIKRHQTLARACDQAVKLRARCKDFGTLTEEEEARVSELNDLVDAARLPLEAAAMEMFDTNRRRATASSLRCFTCESSIAIPPADFHKLMYKRPNVRDVGLFCEKHKVSYDWLLGGDLAGLQRMTRERKAQAEGPDDRWVKFLLDTLETIPPHSRRHAIEGARKLMVQS